MNATCWDGFRARYEAAGHTVVAPSWPHLGDDVAATRASPDPALVGVGLPELVDHYAAIARSLPEPPVLVGHSFGGLVVQLLLDRGVGVAGVAIDSAPPKGVAPTLNAALASLGPSFGPGRLHTMSPAAFAKTFANAAPEADRAALYERYVVPSPGRPFNQLLGGGPAKLDWKNPARGPLLLVAGEKDRTISPSMNRANAKKWKQSPALTELVELPGRDHALIVGPGWEEVADLALSWLVEHAPAGAGVKAAE